MPRSDEVFVHFNWTPGGTPAPLCVRSRTPCRVTDEQPAWRRQCDPLLRKTFCSGCADWDKGRQFRDWLRRIPLLKELPGALAVYFMDLEEMTPEQKRGVDSKAYLTSKITDRVGTHRTCALYSSCLECWSNLCAHTVPFVAQLESSQCDVTKSSR